VTVAREEAKTVDDLIVLGCRNCGKELLARRPGNIQLAKDLGYKAEAVAGRILGIPYCLTCHKAKTAEFGRPR
jgi:hypothetical protein